MAFEEFEAVDVSLNQPLAPGKLQGRDNRRVITANSACKGAHFSDFGLQRCLQPAIEFIDEAFPYDPSKMSCSSRQRSRTVTGRSASQC